MKWPFSFVQLCLFEWTMYCAFGIKSFPFQNIWPERPWEAKITQKYCGILIVDVKKKGPKIKTINFYWCQTISLGIIIHKIDGKTFIIIFKCSRLFVVFLLWEINPYLGREKIKYVHWPLQRSTQSQTAGFQTLIVTQVAVCCWVNSSVRVKVHFIHQDSSSNQPQQQANCYSLRVPLSHWTRTFSSQQQDVLYKLGSHKLPVNNSWTFFGPTHNNEPFQRQALFPLASKQQTLISYYQKEKCSISYHTNRE